jgi:hypothetical protein
LVDRCGVARARQVWVVPTLRDGKVYFQADSDSQLTKARAHAPRRCRVHLR